MEFYLKGTEIKLPFKTVDPIVGKTYQKSTPIQLFKEGFYIGESNAYGFLGKTTKQKKQGVFRIALLGDSYTEGFQLQETFHFSRILEKQLNKQSNQKIEVLNFAISNVVFSEMYLRKELLAKQFDIDLYVYVLDNIHFVYPPEGVLNSVSLHSDNNNLKIKPNPSRVYQYYVKAQPVIDHTSYINFLLDAYLVVRRGQAAPIVLDKLYPPTAYTYNPFYYDEAYSHFTPQTHLILQQESAENTIFVLKESINPCLKKSLAAYNIPIIETLKPLDQVRSTGIHPYYWPLTQTVGHWNYQANAAIGNYLANQLQPYVTQKQLNR